MILVIFIICLIISLAIFFGICGFHISLFYMDKAIIALTVFALFHFFVATKIASGKAVWFWDFVVCAIVVLLYSFLFKLLYEIFPIVAKIINFAISFLSSYLVYTFIVKNFFMHGKTIYLPLLNNNFFSILVNYILMFLLSIIIFVVREAKINDTYGDTTSTKTIYFFEDDDIF